MLSGEKPEERGLSPGIDRFEQYFVFMDKHFYVLFRLVEKDQKTLGGRKLALSLVHKSRWCAWSHYTLPAVRGDAGAECPPGLDAVKCLVCPEQLLRSICPARTVRPGRPCGPLETTAR